jgi:hypothetical protein
MEIQYWHQMAVLHAPLLPRCRVLCIFDGNRRHASPCRSLSSKALLFSNFRSTVQRLLYIPDANFSR